MVAIRIFKCLQLSCSHCVACPHAFCHLACCTALQVSVSDTMAPNGSKPTGAKRVAVAAVATPLGESASKRQKIATAAGAAGGTQDTDNAKQRSATAAALDATGDSSEPPHKKQRTETAGTAAAEATEQPVGTNTIHAEAKAEKRSFADAFDGESASLAKRCKQSLFIDIDESDDEETGRSGAELAIALPTVTCCSCNLAVEQKDATLMNKNLALCGGSVESWRCKKCNALKGRLRTINQGDKEFAQSFRTYSAEAQAKWMVDNHNAIGAQLQANVRKSITEQKLTNRERSFKAVGGWLDEKELDTKYKDRPDQLAEIKKNAQSFTHPTRKVTIYEDLDFTSLDARSEFVSRKEEIEMEAEEKLKKLAAPKAKKEKKVRPMLTTGEPIEDVPKELTEPQTKKATSVSQRLEKLLKQANDIMPKAESKGADIAGTFKQKAKAAMEECTASFGIMQECLQKKKAVKFNDLWKAASEAATSLKTAIEKLEGALSLLDDDE